MFTHVTRRQLIAATAGCRTPPTRRVIPQWEPLPSAQSISRLPYRRCLTGQSGPPSPAPSPQPVEDAVESSTGEGKQQEKHDWRGTAFKMFESAATTAASIVILGIVGFSYTRYYKWNVLNKMERAFEPGDPVLDLSDRSKQYTKDGVQSETEIPENWSPPLKEQDEIDAIVAGEKHGQYHLLIGEKGTGKSSALIRAMDTKGQRGEGVSMFDAHADLEIFRVRLGKALDFEYHEDNIGSLFSIRGPRDASALLDIERALNKLEKVALKRRAKGKHPLVLIINSVHLLRNDEDGRDLIELIQQRAEQWAASHLATVVFNSDDYWVYERLKQNATRMQVHAIKDLPKSAAIHTLRQYRHRYKFDQPTDGELEDVYKLLGGRLTYLNRVSRKDDMLTAAKEICETEKTWFLNQCWILGEEMDDDVMDQQKYASAAMVLAKALVDQENEDGNSYNEDTGHKLPEISLSKARQIMTRADFIQDYDHINIFTIDSKANVRADSVPMQIAFREICSQPGFDQFLEDTLDRISAIESLGRTRELTIKDLWNKGKYEIVTKNHKGAVTGTVEMKTVAGEEGGDGEDEKKDD